MIRPSDLRPFRFGTVFHHLLRALMIVTLGFAATAVFAQDQQNAGETISEIVVTGSRLGRSPSDAPTPLIVVDRDELDAKGTTNIADALNQLPAFGAAVNSSTTSNFDDTAVGVSIVDLRNLGQNRTLVLVNGRRHVAGRAGTSAVDLNSIPPDIIERVEIITGGASAIYGSEAISGVVNIITKQQYDGFEAKAQFGTTSEADGNSAMVSTTYGSEFDTGRGHFLVHASYSNDAKINSSDRKISSVDTFQNADGSITRPARSGVTPNGTFTFPTTTGSVITVTRGTDGLYTAPLTQDNRFDRIGHRRVRVPIERQLLTGTFRYELSNALTFTSEATVARTYAEAQSEPLAIGNFWPLGTGGQSQGLLDLPVDNPYIPQEIRDILDPSATAIAFLSRPVNIGNRTHPVERWMSRVAAGFEGALFKDWNWDGYVQYGQTEEDQKALNLVDLSRFVEAINVEIGPSSEVQCVNPVARAAGCFPYNPFGTENITEEALNYVRAEARFESDIKQLVAAASASGPIAATPMGDILLAAGIEYREEKSSFIADPLTNAGLLAFGQASNTIGEFDVSEAFAEISVPIANELGIVDRASLDAAVRIANYSTIGSASSWKVLGNFDFRGGIRLRATYSDAIRAPNIGELFLPKQGASSRVSDPCEGGGVTSGLTPEAASRRIANCTALGLDASFVPDQLALESVFGFQGGNPDLNEENAKTYTVGLAFSPDSAENLSATIDYWDISIENAIGSISRQLTINECVDQPNIMNSFCVNVTRDATGNIRGVNSLTQNLAKQDVTGIDYGIDYGFNVGSGSVHLTWMATQILKHDLQQFSASTVQDQIGTIGFPEWRHSMRIRFEHGPLAFNWETRYIDKALKDPDVVANTNVIDAVTYSDLQLTYSFGQRYRAYLGIDNAFGEPAPIVSSPHPRTDISTNTASDVYDPIGRRFYIGFKVSM